MTRAEPTTPEIRDAMLAEMWALAGLQAEDRPATAFTGPIDVFASTFAVDALCGASIAAQSGAAAALHHHRAGVGQTIDIHTLHAAAEFWNERLVLLKGEKPPSSWDPIAGAYRCGDGRYVRIHTNFPHHRDGILALLDCENNRDAVTAALSNWTAEAFETAAADAGMIAAMMRSEEEWLNHPQGRALAAQPLFTLRKIGAADPLPLKMVDGEAARPLSNINVLDLTRIIAGPTCGRALASHGARVMRVASPYLPFINTLVYATGAGKHSCHLDLESTAGRAGLERLLAQADIFVQGYRPGAVARHGFAPEDLAERRPGIVAVSLSAYGTQGPWGGKRGFDSIVQTAVGLNHGEGAAAAEAVGAGTIDGDVTPKALPCQALDHAGGHLMAFGAMAAKLRQAREGGSWLVEISLAQVAHFLMRAGRQMNGARNRALDAADLNQYLVTLNGPDGAVSCVKPSGILSQTPAFFDRAPVPLGYDLPIWPSDGPK